MPGRAHKAGDKKAANVDRYGVNPPRDTGEVEEMEAGAEDASYATHTEDEEQVEPLLNGDNEAHEEPPKEWTLADGSPVFRAGKKSLRKQPRLNRRDHGEDSDAIVRRERRAERRARGEIVTPTESSSEASTPNKSEVSNRSTAAAVVVPVPRNLRPAGMVSPTQPRNPPRRQAQVTAPTAKATQAANAVVVKETKEIKEVLNAITPATLGALLLGVLLTGALLVYFLIPRPVTVHTFEGPSDTIKTIDEIINNHSPLQSVLSDLSKNNGAHAIRLTELQDKISTLSKQIDDVNQLVNRNTKDLERLVSAHDSRLAAQTEAQKALEADLQKNVADLKKQMDAQKEELGKLMADLNSKSLDKAIERLEQAREELKLELAVAKDTFKRELDYAIAGAKSEAKDNTAKGITDAKNELNQELNKQITDLKKQIQTQTPGGVSTTVVTTTIDEKDLVALKLRLETVERALDDVKYIKSHAEQVVKDVMAQEETKKKIAALVKEEVDRLTPTGATGTPSGSSIIDEKKVESLVKDLLSKDERFNSLNENVKQAEQFAQSASNAANSAHSHANAAASSATNAASSASTASTSATSASNYAASASEASNAVTKVAGEVAGFATEAASSASNAQRLVDEIRRGVSSAVHGQVSASVGKPDHALYKTGARVLNHKTGWDPRYSWGKNGGLLGWFFNNDQPTRVSPNVALDPSLTPGDCWAFPAKQGNFSVRIPCSIKPTAFTIDHIPVNEALNKGTMPRSFSIYGLLSSTPDGVDYSVAVPLITNAVYSSDGATAQVFDNVANPGDQAFNAFTLAITDNYGSDFTCLYRFRVHGDRVGKCETEAAVSVAPLAEST
jgi:hypothetical protein